MIRATINGISGEFEDGLSILDAARSIGIDIPTLCHDDRIAPAGACRMCLVHIQNGSREAASCATAITDGVVIETTSNGVEEARQWNLRMLAKDYPRQAFELYPEVPFHKMAREHGLTSSDFAEGPGPVSVDDSHTYIQVDMPRCID